ncbi:MAG: type 4a pilus biogenesis protein PilO [Parcubacteria group bacterium]|nr:type 4a pilus biogenesis protein PilO [Parcubacteria group bacterium]
MTKIFSTILALAVAGAVFFVYTQPAYISVKALQVRITEYNAALDKARELQELKRSLLAKYNTFSSEQLDRLTRMLPDHVDNVRLVLDIDNMATRYGMAVQNVVISKHEKTEKTAATVIGSIGEQKQKYDALTLEFSTRGTYANFTKFIQDLETSLRLVELDAFSIDPEQVPKADEKTGVVLEPIYRYNLTLRTFWLK